MIGGRGKNKTRNDLLNGSSHQQISQSLLRKSKQDKNGEEYQPYENMPFNKGLKLGRPNKNILVKNDL